MTFFRFDTKPCVMKAANPVLPAPVGAYTMKELKPFQFWRSIFKARSCAKLGVISSISSPPVYFL